MGLGGGGGGVGILLRKPVRSSDLTPLSLSGASAAVRAVGEMDTCQVEVCFVLR